MSKELALAQHFNVAVSEISETQQDVFECESEPGEYLILTDDEANTAWDEELDYYIDDCILPELPEAYRSYFDSESWKRDAKISDGRGHALSSYDAKEYEEKADGVWYYIYRVN